jgi:hypothetical protein
MSSMRKRRNPVTTGYKVLIAFSAAATAPAALSSNGEAVRPDRGYNADSESGWESLAPSRRADFSGRGTGAQVCQPVQDEDLQAPSAQQAITASPTRSPKLIPVTGAHGRECAAADGLPYRSEVPPVGHGRSRHRAHDHEHRQRALSNGPYSFGGSNLQLRGQPKGIQFMLQPVTGGPEVRKDHRAKSRYEYGATHSAAEVVPTSCIWTSLRDITERFDASR